MKVHFCGVRGSLPAPGPEFVRYGGHTSCIALSHDGAAAPTLMLDAGTGLTAAAALLGGKPFDGTILLSHLHWDHTYGLPFFAAGDRPDATVRVLVPEPEDGSSAQDALTGLMSPPYFPITPGELRGAWTIAAIGPGEHKIEGFAVSAREVPHKGGRTLGYRIADATGTLAYIPDHNPTALGPGPDGFGEYHPAALELARDADVLVHDSQLLPDELAAEGDFGHALGEYAVGLAKRAGTRWVVLFHHKFTRTDDQLDALAARLGATSGVQDRPAQATGVADAQAQATGVADAQARTADAQAQATDAADLRASDTDVPRPAVSVAAQGVVLELQALR